MKYVLDTFLTSSKRFWIFNKITVTYYCSILFKSIFLFSSPAPDEEFSLLSNLTQALSTDEEQYVVRLANSLFLQRGVHFNEDFLQLMKKYFKAEVETVDFSESAAVAERINSWVLNHTESKSSYITLGEKKICVLLCLWRFLEIVSLLFTKTWWMAWQIVFIPLLTTFDILKGLFIYKYI